MNMKKLCDGCGKEIHRWREPYLYIERFEYHMERWSWRVLHFVPLGPYLIYRRGMNRRRFHLGCIPPLEAYTKAT